jgi:hypothetical protein
VKEGRIGGANRMHGTDEKCIKILVKNLKGKDHLQDLGVDGRIILKLIFKEDGKVWTGFIKPKIGTSSGNEPSTYIKDGNFFTI